MIRHCTQSGEAVSIGCRRRKTHNSPAAISVQPSPKTIVSLSPPLSWPPTPPAATRSAAITGPVRRRFQRRFRGRWSVPGSCGDTPYPCGNATNQGMCSLLAGCTWSDATSACSGTPSACSSSSSDLSLCLTRGCTWINGAGYCYGTPTACSANMTSAACLAANCSWSSTPSCAGTPDGCWNFRTYHECYAAGCEFHNGDPSCTGAPTPCSQLSAATCNSQPGCSLGTL